MIRSRGTNDAVKNGRMEGTSSVGMQPAATGKKRTQQPRNCNLHHDRGVIRTSVNDESCGTGERLLLLELPTPLRGEGK